MINLYNTDCMEFMATQPDNSIDAVITDPPYGLSFMGKKWDYDVPSVDVWRECLRVLKHGGHLLSFAGTRTQHRMACNIEDAGFEIRDMIAWVYGSGFPKSLDVSKAIDKAAGAERPDAIKGGHMGAAGRSHGEDYINAAATVVEKNIPAIVGKGALTRGTPQTDAARQWQGWGTALKPALEPITLARKPLEKGLTIAENCLKWGVGGINIDGCRVESNGEKTGRDVYQTQSWKNTSKNGVGSVNDDWKLGRFPANLLHDGSQEVLDLFPQQKSGAMTKPYKYTNNGFSLGKPTGETKQIHESNSGSAARFFYCAKASKSERNRGCEGLEEKQTVGGGGGIGDYLGDVNSASGKYGSEKAPARNNHPTVKPIALMEYLVKLITKEGQTVLDPFAGSGTTGIACKNLNRNAILIERESEYVEIAKCRTADV